MPPYLPVVQLQYNTTVSLATIKVRCSLSLLASGKPKSPKPRPKASKGQPVSVRSLEALQDSDGDEYEDWEELRLENKAREELSENSHELVPGRGGR